MAIPTSYSENDFRVYLYTILGETAGALGLEPIPADFDEAVYDTLNDYGVSDLSEATDITKLRLLGKLNAWKRALAVVSSDYNFSDAGAKYDRSKVFDQIEKNITKLKLEALPYLSAYQIGVSTIDWKNDPYEYVPVEDKPRVPR